MARPKFGVLVNAFTGTAVDSLITGNPKVAGGFYAFYWRELEPTRGNYDWSRLDAAIAEWKAVGKGLALRIVWSSSGYWGNEYSKTPTPQWVLDAGAKVAYHSASGTQVPLFWDPIYLEHAHAFLDAVGARYDGNPDVFFVDATPGAETNPFRGSIAKKDPTFTSTFSNAAASNGVKYSDSTWWSTLQTYIGSVRSHFATLPVLCTLNVGALPGSPTRLDAVGNLATQKGLLVGQNGLTGTSFRGNSGNRWRTWAGVTGLYFETASGTGGTTGTLQQVVDAAQTVMPDWLNFYYADVLKATQESSTYDASYAVALAEAAAFVGD